MPKKYISYSLMKYIRPIWYFHLISNDGESVVWTNYNQLSRDEKEVIHYDQDYSNQVLSNWDASYQALMKGIVKKTGNNIQTDEIELLPADIYRFIRKYHKKIWLYLVFFQRLSSLFNPISEFIGLWQTRHVQKYNLFHPHYVYDEYPDYDSSLIRSNPFLSIIIPTYNRYEPLNNLLEDLCQNLNDATDICVACDLTLDTEYIKTQSVSAWKKTKIDLHKRPTLFIIHKPLF